MIFFLKTYENFDFDYCFSQFYWNEFDCWEFAKRVLNFWLLDWWDLVDFMKFNLDDHQHDDVHLHDFYDEVWQDCDDKHLNN
jgi:hypothetical protein